MIKITDLHHKYPGSEKYSLESINLEIKENKITALMGENGSGKTTLLRLIAGLLEPTKGKIKSDHDEIGFSPEDPELGFFAEDVKTEVEFYPKNLGLDHEQKAKRALTNLGIQDLKDRLPHLLSSGEQRLVSIASVLSGDPDLLILDEPTHSMHKRGEETIGKVLKRIDKTIIFSTHSSEFTLLYADEIIVIHEGKILAKGKTEEVLQREPILEKAGIRVPGLVQWAKEKDLREIPGSMEEAYNLANERGELG
ncbi:MAG: energy-coupling factor ABC transporter ATP-binding protein [Thermoplasmatota archaeon]